MHYSMPAFMAITLLLAHPSILVNQSRKSSGATPFFIACQEGQCEVTKLMLKDLRIDLNRARYDGTTPIFHGL